MEMFKIKKKSMRIVALSLVASLLMLLGNPVPRVYANAVSGEWTYYVQDEKAIILGYSGSLAIAKLTIPATLDDYPVSRISTNQLRNLRMLLKLKYRIHLKKLMPIHLTDVRH